MEMLELIKKAQKGNNGAFSQIYDTYADLLFRFIKIKVQNQQEAEDLLQEAFVKAWRALPLHHNS
jgi:RNA polymerase sigma-70 factor, ECF subfamily